MAELTLFADYYQIHVFDDDPATTERMRVQIWPAQPSDPVVLKRWLPPAG